jgi:hypothetical protein
MSSVLVPSGNLLPVNEVLPGAAAIRGLDKSSMLVQRRRVRTVPQTASSAGTATGNAAASGFGGGGGAQVTFTIADQGGLLDPASICVVYNIAVSGTGNTMPDDGHPFTKAQVILNGQALTDNQQAAKYTNMEVKLNSNQAWYKTAGSFCGFELLNNEQQYAAATATPTVAQQQAYTGAFGDVLGNLAQQTTRYKYAAGHDSQGYANFAGQQRVLPLGLVSGVGRMNQYIPLNVAGQVVLNFITGQRGEVLVQASGNTDADYALFGIALEYDIVVPDPRYADILQRAANDPAEGGLNMAFESEIMASAASISASAASLTENSLIVSRATNNLTRVLLVAQPTTLMTSVNFPAQSCFNHTGAYKLQFRVGSNYYPALAAEGDASMWAMSISETAGISTDTGVINRLFWSLSTTAAAGTISEPSFAVGGSRSFADSFIGAYNFRTVKGRAMELDLDGVSLSGASGSQLVCILTAAPPVGATPTLCLVAIRTIQCQGGAVRVLGA